MSRKRITRECLVCKSLVRTGAIKYCSKPCYWADKAFNFERDFHPRVDGSGGPDTCWRWLGNIDEDGYGRIRVKGQRLRVHRIAWELANGCTATDDVVMRHLCPGGGNRWCCNPRHLTIGTVQDNADDTVRAGRQIKGEQIFNSKLTADQVREIRRRAVAGETMRGLGRAFGVRDSTIGQIVKGRTWRHVA